MYEKTDDSESLMTKVRHKNIMKEKLYD